MRQRIARRLLDLLRFDGGNRQMARLAGGPDEPRHPDAVRLRTAPLVLLEKPRVDAGRDRVARGALVLHLGDDDALGVGQGPTNAIDFALERHTLLLELRERRVERFPLLHQLELAVLDVALVTAELLDVGLHGLQLARRADLAGVHLRLDLGGLLREATSFVVELLLLPRATVARGPCSGGAAVAV